MNVNFNISTMAPVLFCIAAITGCTSNSRYSNSAIEPFLPIPADFSHQWNKETHPFTGAAVIDVDNDGKYEVFVGGGQGQADVLLSYQNGKLVDEIGDTGLSNPIATYGATAIDLDGDADTDLILARNDGVHLYINQAGKFIGQRIAVDLPEHSVPFSVAVSDIDQDGDGDLYISIFVDFASFRSPVFNDPTHAKANRLLLNNGDLTFTDITASSGTAGKQNTFLSVFADLNGDSWQDLIVAQNTGEVEIFQNMKDKTFKPVPTPSQYGFWMGLAIGDIDHDGDQDLYFSNVGSSIPEFLTNGDIRDDQPKTHEALFLRNEGDFRFTDVTETYQLSDEGFSWGAVFEDLNLDGQLDLLVAQNYIKWPVHKFFKLPGRAYLQTANNNRPVFEHTDTLGLNNKYFGQSPLIADIDGDGRQDVMWININGPVRAFRNTSSANYVTVVVPDTVSLLGTQVTVETQQGQSYTRDVLAGIGLMTDQTPDLSFGLGVATGIKRIKIKRPNGMVEYIDSPSLNSKVVIE